MLDRWLRFTAPALAVRSLDSLAASCGRLCIVWSGSACSDRHSDHSDARAHAGGNSGAACTDAAELWRLHQRRAHLSMHRSDQTSPPTPKMRVSLLSLLSLLGVCAVAAQSAQGYPCSYTASDGASFDFSALTTATGTLFKGTHDDLYNINVCGVAQGQRNAHNTAAQSPAHTAHNETETADG